MKHAVLLILLSAGLVMFGCQKKVATELETPAEETAEKAEEGEMEVTEEVVSAEDISMAETGTVTETAAGASLPYENVYFGFDRYDLTAEAKERLMEVSNRLVEDNASVLIEGHCDERGTNEYNLALGDRRAGAVKDFLSASGVKSSRIETISFGEEKPVCTASSEDCWQQNRRAHIITEGGK